MNSSPTESVRVYVRCRPLIPSDNSNQCADIKTTTTEISISDPKAVKTQAKSYDFTFDGVFDTSCNQEKLYADCVDELVENVVDGYNATIFAYGQTASGKTFSMMGNPESDTLKGITPRSFEQILSIINENPENKVFMITVSFLEIYNEEVHDLLVNKKTSNKCELRESPDKGFYVPELSQLKVSSVQEMIKHLNYGSNQRSVGETKMNERSSRSHAIFSIRVESSIEDKPGHHKSSVGKLNLVDLAGSERQDKTGAQNERLKEGININLSLTKLGKVIAELAENKAFISYRDSNLTKLLKDSLGGNSKTIMLANINPCIRHYEESLSTLRYASRAKKIKNKPRVNEDPKDAMLKEIQKLKEMLANRGGIAQSPEQEQERHAKIKAEGIQEQTLKEMEARVKEMEELKARESKDKEKLKGELSEKEKLYEKIKMEKEAIEKMLQEKEQGVLRGQQVQEDHNKLEEMRKRIRKEKKKQEELIEENRRLEERLNDFEARNEKMQEELDSSKELNKKLWTQIPQKNNDVKKEKEKILFKIDEKEKDLTFYEELVELLVSKEDLKIIRRQWALNKNQIPQDLFKDKEVVLPNLKNFAGNAAEIHKDDDDDFDLLRSPKNENISQNPVFSSDITQNMMRQPSNKMIFSQKGLVSKASFSQQNSPIRIKTQVQAIIKDNAYSPTHLLRNDSLIIKKLVPTAPPLKLPRIPSNSKIFLQKT